MTITQLQAFARAALDYAVDSIREQGSIRQQFHLVGRDDAPIQVMVLDGSITNNPDALAAFFEVLRLKIKTDNVEAVVMLSDVFVTGELTMEQAREKQRRGWNVEQAAQAGLCEKHEAVMVVLESPIYCQILRQKYRREPNVELVGELEIVDSTTYLTNFNLFREPQSLDELFTLRDEIAVRKAAAKARKETVQ